MNMNFHNYKTKNWPVWCHETTLRGAFIQLYENKSTHKWHGFLEQTYLGTKITVEDWNLGVFDCADDALEELLSRVKKNLKELYVNTAGEGLT